MTWEKMNPISEINLESSFDICIEPLTSVIPSYVDMLLFQESEE